MTARIGQASPRLKARIAGVFYLIEGSPAVFQQVVIAGLVVSGDPAATATNVLAHGPLFWLWFTAALIAVAFHIAYTVLFYDLFRPVNRSLSLLALSFSLVACALQAFATLFQLASLVVLGGEGTLSAFTVDQVQGLALMFLNLHAQAFDIYLVFFGFWLILVGYLVFRSTFMPRIIGVLMALDGLGWVLFLSPQLANHLYAFIAAAAALAEIPLALWLLLRGVNVQRWKEQSGASSEASSYH